MTLRVRHIQMLHDIDNYNTQTTTTHVCLVNARHTSYYECNELTPSQEYEHSKISTKKYEQTYENMNQKYEYFTLSSMNGRSWLLKKELICLWFLHPVKWYLMKLEFPKFRFMSCISDTGLSTHTYAHLHAHTHTLSLSHAHAHTLAFPPHLLPPPSSLLPNTDASSRKRRRRRRRRRRGGQSV